MSKPVMVHDYHDFADVEMSDGEVVQKVELCSHFLGEAHTNPQAIQDEMNRRRRAALKAEGKLEYDRGVRDPGVEVSDLGAEIVHDGEWPGQEDEVAEEKYVVFKRGEWDNIVQIATKAIQQEGVEMGVVPLTLEDAVVIRLQDVFAGPGLYAYANAIQTGLDLDLLADECGMSDEERGRLEGIRDYFAEMADRAENAPRKKLPD